MVLLLVPVSIVNIENIVATPDPGASASSDIFDMYIAVSAKDVADVTGQPR
jgi:hypothetical protein